MHKIHSIERIDGFRNLSARETQLIVLASEGLTDKEIAKFLGISCGTVVTMWSRMRAKLGITSRVSAVAVVVSSVSRLLERSHRSDAGLEAMKILVSAKGIVLSCDSSVILALGIRPGDAIGNLAVDRVTTVDGSKISVSDQPWTKALELGQSSSSRLAFRTANASTRVLTRCRLAEDPILGRTALVEFEFEPGDSNLNGGQALVQAS